MDANFMYDLTLPSISKLQQALPSIGPQMEFVSVTFDPKYAFLIYAPVAYLVSPLVGKRLILAVVLAEWINQILKWASMGERPYWYVHSSGKFDASLTPIRQFNVTCETGPGAPSGHSQLTATVWLVIIESLNELMMRLKHIAELLVDSASPGGPSSTSHAAKRPTLRRSRSMAQLVHAKRHDLAKLSLNTFYFALVSLVAFSRVYLACHFPQQCVAGALLGYAIAKYALSVRPSAKFFIALSGIMMSSVFAVYALMRAFGFNPSWTFELAAKHCEQPENIHIDTTPFFSIMRYCGFALGTGLGLLLPANDSATANPTPAADDGLLSASAHATGPKVRRKQTSSELETAEINNKPNYLTSVSTKLVVALVSAQLVDNLAHFVSSANVNTFYAAAFAVYTGFSFMIVSM